SILLAALEKIKLANGEIHQKIINCFLIIFKCKTIDKERKRYRVENLQNPEHWRSMLDYDLQLKTDVFGSKISDLEKDLNNSDMEFLSKIFLVKDNPVAWLSVIEACCNTQVEALVTWEAKTQLHTQLRHEDGVAYFLRKSDDLGRFAYRRI